MDIVFICVKAENESIFLLQVQINIPGGLRDTLSTVGKGKEINLNAQGNGFITKCEMTLLL